MTGTPTRKIRKILAIGIFAALVLSLFVVAAHARNGRKAFLIHGCVSRQTGVVARRPVEDDLQQR